MGDFNDLRKFYNVISRVTQLKPHVKFFTRGEHILDQLFTNIDDYEEPRKLPPVGRSDHCCILWCPSQNCPVSFSKLRIRKVSKAGVSSFHQAVCEYDWLSLVSETKDVNDSCDVFLQCLQYLFDLYFPFKTVRVRSRESPWIKLSLKLLINGRDVTF